MSETRDALLTWLVYGHGFKPEVMFKGLSGIRRFRWDAADEALKVAVEYNGVGIGHTWRKEQAKDHEKYNEGALCGWLVIICSAESVNTGKCFEYVEQAIEYRTRESK